MLHRLTRPLARAAMFAVALTAIACADKSPTEPETAPASPTTIVTGVPLAASRDADLGTCDSLAADAGSRVLARVYAQGVQVYRWNGTAWSFVAPEARLTADAAGHGVIGVHYAGPTWETHSGSTVKGAVARRCTPDANAIPWLLLNVVSDTGAGLFHGATQIQRLHTVGGRAPAVPGADVGEEARVPYTALYVFHGAR